MEVVAGEGNRSGFGVADLHPGWVGVRVKAAQTVQVSAYPFQYAQWETQAADLVAKHWTS
ncbi:hypothetical protein HCB17_25000 [Salinispora arenicola]|uniref:hypothetical protein n=1 Tax=Salinispora arenicola TaxID=168697 RepID=UPI00036FA837|nr:hypothetical protein [Salinispora arenicola]NIL44008.1 hypothetical protein [Salinispora arenicola]